MISSISNIVEIGFKPYQSTSTDIADTVNIVSIENVTMVNILLRVEDIDITKCY